MADELAVLTNIDKKLSALIALMVEQHLRETESTKYKPRSADRILTDLGMSGSEVGRLLGKSQQAVSQALIRQSRGPGRSSGKAGAAKKEVEEQQ